MDTWLCGVCPGKPPTFPSEVFPWWRETSVGQLDTYYCDAEPLNSGTQELDATLLTSSVTVPAVFPLTPEMASSPTPATLGVMLELSRFFATHTNHQLPLGNSVSSAFLNQMHVSTPTKLPRCS